MRVITAALITGFWLAMMGWLIFREILPSYWVGRAPTYRIVIGDRPLKPRVEKAGLFVWNQRIGSVRTEIRPAENGRTEIETITTVNLPDELKALGNPDDAGAPPTGVLEMRSQVLLTATQELDRIDANLKLPTGSRRLAGRVIDGGLEIDLFDGERKESSHRVENIQLQTLSGGMSQFLFLPDLYEGKEWSLQSLDPFTLKLETAHAKVLEKEQIIWNKTKIYAFRVEVTRGANKLSTAWVHPDGRVLKETFLDLIQVIRDPDPPEKEAPLQAPEEPK